MINRSEIYMDITQKLNLNSRILEKFIEQNDVFFQELENEIEALTPYEAIEVLSVLIYFNEYFESNSKWENLVYLCLNNVRNGIYNNVFNSISVFNGLPYIAFIIQELTLKLPSLNRFMQSLDNLLEDNINSYLNVSDNPKFNLGNNFELITGLSGPLRYYLNYKVNEQSHALVNKLVDSLIVRSCPKNILEYNIPGWHYYPSALEKRYMTSQAINGCINYGVSHGMGGPLVSLSLAYKNGIRSEGLLKAIEDLISEYLKSYYYVNNIIFWPGRITFEQYVHQERINYVQNRMSWCYGSVGILRALYIASASISNEETKSFVLDEMIKIAELDTSFYLLDSPIVCHGLAGVAIIMKKMYIDTKNNVFANKVAELTNQLVYDFAYKDCENIVSDNENKIRKYDYLEGYTGILQTIYSLINDVHNINEKRLLII